ncbi:uncharacterized protein TNCV_1790241 [Trichonephila clavipes]|nr:uncharacterized protein TNCV_1790241 [Trichonephila clavipes]
MLNISAVIHHQYLWSMDNVQNRTLGMEPFRYGEICRWMQSLSRNVLVDIPADDQSSVNIVIDLNIISELLKSMARCEYCNKCDSLIITKDARSRRGLCVSLTLQCTFCGQAFTSMSSNSTNGVYDINVRLAYGLRCIGKGSNAAKIFCVVMNLPPPPAKFQRYNGIFLESLSKVSDASMKKSVEETVEMNNSNRDITAAFGSSWQKRDHTSLNGVVSATSLETSKVLDFECLSKYCFVCKKEKNQ